MMNKLFINIIKENAKETIWAITFKIMLALSVTLVSYSLKLMFDAYILGQHEFYNAVFFGGVIVIITVILSLLSDYFKAKYIRETNISLKLKMTENLIENSYDLVTIRDTGKSMSWFLNDAQQIETQAFDNFINFIFMITLVISALISIATLHWSILFVSVVFSICLLFIPTITQKYITQAQENYTVANEKYTESTRDNLEGLGVFFIGNALSAFKLKMENAVVAKETQYFNFSITQAKVGCVMLFLTLLSQIGLVVYVLFIASFGLTTEGSVLGIASLAGNLFNGVQGLMRTISNFKAANVLLSKFQNDTKEKLGFSESVNRIVGENIAFQYGDNTLFDKYSFEFHKGKKYAVVGASGSGKSTLLKMLVGLIPIETGQVKVNDVDINAINLKEYYQHVAYIEQSVYLINGTIRDNITLGIEVSEERLHEVIEKVQLESFIKKQPLGLHTVFESNGQGISGGEKQRIALARALIKDVDFIIIDESTSQLDKITRETIEKTVLNFQQVGLIYVSHHTNEEILEQFDELIDSATFNATSK